MITQALIVRYTAFVSENFFLIFGERLFQQNRNRSPRCQREAHC